MRRHLRQLHRAYGERAGVRVARKHICWYLEGRPDAEQTRKMLMRCDLAQEQFTLLGRYFEKQARESDRIAA